MKLWREWMRCTGALRGACTRRSTFLWLLLVLAAMAARPDLLGVSSFVRAAWLEPAQYHMLLHFFHSPALSLPLLVDAWVRLVLRLFNPVTEGEFLVFVGDGLKVPKEGKKMPAVKNLHQESDDNAKPAFIMGHSFQAVGLLVRSPLEEVFAVPLVCRICEGLIWRRCVNPKSLLDKMVDLFLLVAGIAKRRAVLVADAYYASWKVINPLLQEGHQLVTKVKRSAVAFQPAPNPKVRRRGRPRKYGPKVKLRNLFKAANSFSEADSPVYGETGIRIQYRAVDLLWRPVGRIVRFVLVKHPTRGNIILLCTAVDFDPLAIIRLYGYRFKIEVSFKQAIHTMGTYAYHFWMRPMKKIGRRSGNQHLEDQTEEYRQAVARKMDAYHRYVQIGLIVQGLLQHLAINFRDTVWSEFRTWLRTMKTKATPSELVVSQALKLAFPQFLLDATDCVQFKKFVLDRAISERIPGFKAA
jgi:hypothetical protein